MHNQLFETALSVLIEREQIYEVQICTLLKNLTNVIVLGAIPYKKNIAIKLPIRSARSQSITDVTFI